MAAAFSFWEGGMVMDEETLKAIEELRQSKDMDAIANLFVRITAMYGLTTAEVAALNYYTMRRTFETPVHQIWFKERLNLDVSNLSVGGTFKVQEALVAVYVDELKKGGKLK